MRTAPDSTVLPTRRRALGLGAAGLLLAGTARGAMLPDTVRYVLGAALGTSYDRYGRVFAQALSTLRPSMRVVVESMPRANGRLAARQLATTPGDGATIGSFQTALVYSELLGDDGVAFETARFGWIGSFNVEPRVLVAATKLGVSTIDELRRIARPIPVGADTTTSVSAREPLLLNDLLGTRLEPVPGFTSPARRLALVSGELAAATSSLDAVQSLIASGDVRVLLRLDGHPLPPPLDAVPSLDRLAGARRDSAVFTFLDAHARLGRWLCLPPGTPPGIVAAWRALFAEVVASETYRRLAREAGLAQHGTTIVTGAEIDAALAAIFTARTAMASALHAALACGSRIARTGDRTC